jgi:Asp-tRNA(Asn)/Glu-tRNA(Gln) amidotransferase A subunit family amidase
MLSALAGRPLELAPVVLERTRLAILSSEDMPLAPGVRQLYEQVAALLADQGVELVEVEWSFEESRRLYETIASAESYVALAGLLDRPDLLGDETVRLIEAGSRVGRADYEAAQRRRTELRREYVGLLDQAGAVALVTPAVGCEAPLHGRKDELSGRFDWFLDANLGGLPACVLPIGRGDEELPVGSQVVGRAGEDATVLGVAAAVECLLGISDRLFGP